MKMFAEDIAIEVLKTVITSDTRKLVQVAEAENMDPAKLAVAVSFDYAQFFLDEYNERFVNTNKKRKSR